jgi:hypothetical protein
MGEEDLADFALPVALGAQRQNSRSSATLISLMRGSVKNQPK